LVVTPRLSSAHPITALSPSLCVSPPIFSSLNPAPPDIYTLSLHDALPISRRERGKHAEIVNEAMRALMSTMTMKDAIAHFIVIRSEEHTSELQSRVDLVCRLLLEKKK